MKCKIKFLWKVHGDKKRVSRLWAVWVPVIQVHVPVHKCQLKNDVWLCSTWVLYPFHHIFNTFYEVLCSRGATFSQWWCCPMHLLRCIQDFECWILYLEFEDKHSWLICLLHVSLASGSGLCKLSCWNAVSFIPSTAAKSLLNKKADGVKVSCFLKWRKCFVTCISLLERSVSKASSGQLQCIVDMTSSFKDSHSKLWATVIIFFD